MSDYVPFFGRVAARELKQLARLGGLSGSTAQRTKMGEKAYKDEMRRRVMERWHKRKVARKQRKLTEEALKLLATRQSG